jgi:hypothetical protein
MGHLRLVAFCSNHSVYHEAEIDGKTALPRRTLR